MAPLLDERSRRRWAASEAHMIGHGGVSAVAEATGLARRTIYRGLEDLEDRGSVGNGRIRRQGGGRKSRITEDPTLLADLKSLLEPATRGDPMRRQLWTSLSLRKLCAELKGRGHDISYPVVGDCLHKLHYSRTHPVMAAELAVDNYGSGGGATTRPFARRYGASSTAAVHRCAWQGSPAGVPRCRRARPAGRYR